jgi:ligand-binding sensor domain-containing protein
MKELAPLRLLFTVLLLTSCTGTAQPTVSEPTVPPRAATLKLTVTESSDTSDEVRCGLQDRAGSLWFGTTGDGVYRFDGKSFTHYTVHDGLSNKTIWSILEDKQGRIWFGTAAGLCRWDGKAIAPIPLAAVLGVPAPAAGAVPAEPAIWSMLEDKSGTIWFGTSEGMVRFADGVLSPFLKDAAIYNPDNLHLRMVADILEDRQGTIWFASGMPPGMEGLCRFDGKSLAAFNPGGEQWIRSAKEDRQGNLWLGTRNKGVWKYESKAFSKVEQPDLGWPMLVDRLGNVWFGGEEVGDTYENSIGIWKYDGTTFQRFPPPPGARNFSVWCIVESRDGNIWVGTRNTGLYRFDGKSFTRLSE